MLLLRALPLLSSLVFPLAMASQLPINPATEQPLSGGEPTLYDLIMIERRATIFGDYLRKLNDVAGLLNNREALTTVLVPTNRAMLALARKPYVLLTLTSFTGARVTPWS